MEQTTRILWISDIHYRDDFEFPDVLAERNHRFLESVSEYLDFIKSEDKEDNKLHYYILSGDLGFSGKKGEYKKLNDDIVYKLNEIFKSKNQHPILLCCPGNHDVNREKPTMYEGFIGLIEKHIENFDNSSVKQVNKNFAELQRNANAAKRESLLKDYGVNNAKMIFENYSKFVKEHLRNYKLGSNDLFESYRRNNYLYGQILDHKQKIIFTILNSAWFSLGDGFDKLIVNYYKKRWEKEFDRLLKLSGSNSNELTKLKKSQEEFMLRVTKVKEACSEFGKQIVSQSIIESEKFAINLKSYPHYTSMTVMHHPLSWLEESQKYDYENNGETELIKLLKKSDILLTGHEHVNIHITPEILYDKLIHIPGGMFIQDKNQFYNGGQNRFAFLEIDNKNKNLCIKNYLWNTSTRKWIKNLEEENKWEKIYLKEKLTYFISKESKDGHISEFFSNFKPLIYLNKYMSPGINKIAQALNKWETVNGYDESQKISEIYKLKVYSKRKQSFLIVVPKVSGEALFFNKSNSDQLRDRIDDFILSNRTKEKHVIFLQLDLVTTQAIPEKNGLEFNYYSYPDIGEYVSDTEIRATFDKIQKRADAKFNLFRNLVFTAKEASESIDNHSKTRVRFSDYIDLRLSNSVIPFWAVRESI